MRYSVISQGLPLLDVEAKVRLYGGKDIRPAPLSGQVFCELDPDKAVLLAREPGLAVRPVHGISLRQSEIPLAGAVTLPRSPVEDPARRRLSVRSGMVFSPVYAAAQTALSTLFYDFRTMFDPPVTGAGFTIAVLDSGVRKTHLGIKDKVVYEANFSDSPTAEDVFDHGTGVAYLAAGGRHGPGEDAGMAPGAALMNLKVIGDNGQGSSEDVTAGLERAMDLAQGYPPGNPMHPDLVNLSFGSPDSGDPLDPVRVAARAAVSRGLWVIAAAGNSGPGTGSVGSPASDPQVFAAGAMTFDPWDIWEGSSRGPTKEGNVKPDLVFYGVNILTASARGDTAYTLKAGTSFAAPAASGMVAVVNEGYLRWLGRPYSQAEAWTALPWITRKPPGQALGKDNTYGYGMPMGDLVGGMFRPKGVDMSSVLNAVPSLLGLGLMAAMVGMVTKGGRK